MAHDKQPEGLAARAAAAQKLGAVLAGDHFAPITSSELAAGRDRAFANRLVTVALRRTGHLNIIISTLLERGLPKRSGNFEAVLRLALAELLFVDDGAAHSALFLAVELVKRDKRALHLAKLMNGVLRRAQREAASFQQLEAIKLFPDWLARRWTKAYGAEAVDRFAAALLAGAPLDLTLRDADGGAVPDGNTELATQLAAELGAELGAKHMFSDSYRLAQRESVITAMPGYADGQFWVQDFSAAIPARLFDLKAGARVLDMCAAPGGKTAQLAKAGYQVTALDNSESRMARVRENLARLGYDADLQVADGTTFEPQQKFDGVLVDAPCTATGTFRRHPELVWQRQEKDIAGRVALQRQLLEQGVRCLNPGGELIYATCSLEPEEGEQQVDWLLAQGFDIQLVPMAPQDAGVIGAGIDPSGCIRVYPGFAQLPAEGELDGFFVARFRMGG